MTDKTPFAPFPKIPRKSAFLKDVREGRIPLPSGVYGFVGAVKLHGCNAAVVFNPDGTVSAQSRNRMVTPEDDNYGFAAWVAENAEHLQKFGGSGITHAYGEWCGPGIQSKVAICKLPARAFFPFAYRTEDGELHYGRNPNLGEKPLPMVRIKDGATPEEVADDLEFTCGAIDEITDGVGKHCPVAARHGIDGFGEGVVWHLARYNDDGTIEHLPLYFKTKTDHHKAGPRVKPVRPPRMTQEEIEAALTKYEAQAHYDKALDKLGGTPVLTDTGAFLRLFMDDLFSDSPELRDKGCQDLRKSISSWAARTYRDAV